MTAVADYIKRSQAELAKVIAKKQKNIETERKGFIKELEGEIMQIKAKKWAALSGLTHQRRLDFSLRNS